MANIHPTAVVDAGAEISETAQIGPYCIIGNGVKLSDGVVLKAHVCVEGDTEIGENTIVYPFATIGMDNQDLKFKGEAARTRIGKNNKIREHVTIHKGTAGDKMETRVGDDCLLMVGSHVAHDCTIGNNVIMANNATLGGHVTVEDFVIIGGLAAVQQFVRIGAFTMIGGVSAVVKDVIPYSLVVGERASLKGLNLVGLRRRGFDNKTIQNLMYTYGRLFEKEDDKPLMQRVDELRIQFSESESVLNLLSFFVNGTKQNYCTPK